MDLVSSNNAGVEDPSCATGAPARAVVVGGFLGSGKTGALDRLAAWLRRQNIPVRVIVGASGPESIDFLRFCDQGFDAKAVREKFPSSAALAETPDPSSGSVLLIEAGGTSANLPAALGSLRSAGLAPAPLTVLVDAPRALKLLGLANGHKFLPPVERLYRRQIEEASLLLLQQADALPANSLPLLRKAIGAINPCPILELNSSGDDSIDRWWRLLSEIKAGEPPAREADPAPWVDADRSLAALNCVVRLSSIRYFDGNKVVLDLAAVVQSLLREESAEMAHLKAVLSSIDAPGEHACVSVTNDRIPPALIRSLPEPIQIGRMVLNLRAESDPEVLHSAVNRALFAIVEKSPDIFARMEHNEHFRP